MSLAPRQNPDKFPFVACLACALVTIAIAVIALLGWIVDAPLLKGVLGGSVAMNPLTAVSLIAGASALIVLARETASPLSKKVGLALAASVALVGTIKLCYYAFGIDAAIDRLMFASALAGNQIAPNTAALFVLVGTCLLLLDTVSHRGLWFMQPFVLLIAALSFLAIVGYLLEGSVLYGIPSYIPMARNTALAFLFLSVGILISRPHRGVMGVISSHAAGGVMARRLLPAGIGIPLLLGWLAIQGQAANFYDAKFGMALLVASTSIIYFGFICWTARVLSAADLERKNYEDGLKEAKQRADDASRTKSQFLANMSHEIRTPLNGILGFAEVLRRGVGTEEQRAGYLDTIHSSGRHLLTLIDDILDLSKIEAGHMEFEQITTSPHQVISDVLSVLRVRAQEKCLRLEAVWASDVPETIITDPARLRQLLMNVVGNAIKFTERGGVTLTASIVPSAPEPRFVIEVRDTGIGMAAHRLESIFQPFTQADSSITRRFGGTGLGMTISRHIARGLGGDITVKSELGRGSTFRITLATGPLDGVHIYDTAPSEVLLPRHRPKHPQDIRLTGARILLVEDGESNRDLVELVLREAGAQVVSAEDGQQGVDAVQSSQFDLIFMDVQMPVMDGFTATRRIRKLGSTVPIIALTAHAMRGDKEHCLNAGFTGYLSKPIEIDELLMVASDALGGKLHGPMTPDEASAAHSDRTEANTPPPIESTLPVERPEFRRIVNGFVEKLSVKLDELDAAIQVEDLDQVAELAHWLKGAGGTMGFDCFTEPARRLEQQAKDGMLAALQPQFVELQALADRIAVPA